MPRDIKNDRPSRAQLEEIVRAIVKQEIRRRDGAISGIDHTTLTNIGTNTHSQIDDHIAAPSGVHGITGDVVGHDDSQALFNKTLVSPLITTPTIDNILGLTYTPTLSGLANVTGTPTVSSFWYQRVGQIVVVGGTLTGFQPTTIGVTTDFELTIPVGGNFTGSDDAAGALGDATGTAGQVRGVSGADRVLCRHIATVNTPHQLSLMWIYVIR